MKLQEVTGYNLKSQTILNENWDILTESQRLHVSAWERHVWPLMEEINRLLEAELTADQIQQIFSNAEKLSAEQGTGLTALGKAGKVTAEVSGKLKSEIEKLLSQAKNSEPVKNMDAQFDKLRSQIADSVKNINGGDKILQGVDKWRKFAEENPAKQAFIIGALTSVLAFASGGVMSGAAIGFFLRLANNTLKGDQLSTALGKGVRGAAIGAVAGAIGAALGDNIEISTPDVEGGEVEVSTEVDSNSIASSSDDIENTASALGDVSAEEYKLQYAEQVAKNMSERFNMPDLPPEMIEKIANNMTIEGDYPDGNFVTRFEGKFIRGNIYLTPEESESLNAFINNDDPFAPNGMLGQETTEWIKENVEGADEVFAAQQAASDAAAEQLRQRYDDMSADEQKEYDNRQRQFRVRAGESPGDYTPPGTPKYETSSRWITDKDQLVESLWDDFDMYEVSFADTMKKAKAGAAKIGQKGIAAAKAGAKAAGKELGQKVTVRKLNSQWKKMGSPTDSGSIANLLADAGMNDEQIGTVAQQNNVELPVSTTASSDQSDQQTTQQATDATQTDSAGQTSTTTDIESVAAEIKKLPPKTIEKIKAELQKQIQKSTSTS